jgi:hypothetical protein
MCAWYQRAHLAARDLKVKSTPHAGSIDAAACVPRAIAAVTFRVGLWRALSIRVNLGKV